MALRTGSQGQGSGGGMGNVAGEVRASLGKPMREILMDYAMKRPGGAIASASTSPKPRIESNHLFQGNSEIVIVHQNKE
jgi:hypothetical protein